MPLYEYECSQCHHRFERLLQRFTEETPKCPECGGAAPQQMSAPAIQFKGSGWYVTDYAKKSSAPASNSSAAKDKSGSDSSSSSTDSSSTEKSRSEGTGKSEKKKTETKKASSTSSESSSSSSSSSDKK